MEVIKEMENGDGCIWRKLVVVVMMVMGGDGGDLGGGEVEDGCGWWI